MDLANKQTQCGTQDTMATSPIVSCSSDNMNLNSYHKKCITFKQH